MATPRRDFVEHPRDVWAAAIVLTPLLAGSVVLGVGAVVRGVANVLRLPMPSATQTLCISATVVVGGGSALLSALFLWGFARILRSRTFFQVAEDGLVCLSPAGRQTIPWAAISRVDIPGARAVLCQPSRFGMAWVHHAGGVLPLYWFPFRRPLVDQIRDKAGAP